MPRGKHSGHIKGSRHHRWNISGKMISEHGYVKIRVEHDNPLADRNGYAYEHLVVWVSAGNPIPGRSQLIHHRNGSKVDNRLVNLELKERAAHNAEHNAKRFGRPALTIDDAAMIRKRREAGELLKIIAKDYGVTFQTISKIARGQRWKD